jgi:DNA-binding response OmpR family regulator
MANILIVDDEKDIVNALKIYLTAEQHNTFAAYTGKQALEILQREEIHLVLMDVMMPEMDGISALSALREHSNVPVILLTAKSEDSDKIMGLNIGADDYVTKPFNPVELLARVRSQLRRYMTLGGNRAVPESGALQVGPFILDDRTKTLTQDGEPVALTPTEYRIMKLFMSRPGEVLSPKEIYRRVWEDEPYGADSTVAVHIRHLREKLEINPAEPRYLKVVWAQGYKLCGK